MAQVISSDRKFQDRGYVWQMPTMDECRDMGWTVILAYQYCRYNEAYVSDMKQWCRANIWWQDYVWSYNEVAVKNPKDATMFLLRWAQ
jgi:hypothetical protein